MLIPLRAFALQHANTSREAFLATVTEPHLLLRQALKPQNLATNTPWGATQPANEVWGTTMATGGSTSPPPPEPSPGVVAPVTPVLIAVRKRPRANAFPDMVTLGRATNNDVVINDDRMSRVQCFFRRDEGRWLVGDMRSTNGTVVNGVAVHERPAHVAAGSTILLSGAITLLFFDPEALYALARATLIAAAAGRVAG